MPRDLGESSLHQRQSVRARAWAMARMMRVDRPIGTLLLLWPTLWALWLASGGRPDPKVFVIFVLGTFVMRSAGCVINDYIDRDIDPFVARTKDRPIPAGEVKPAHALVLFVALLLIALALVSTLGAHVVRWAAVGAVLASTYPFFKRFTHLPQFYLGAAFGWGIPMAYIALSGTTDAVCWILFAANVLWAAAYDTMYAMADRDDDLKIGVKSTAILFGRADRAFIAAMQTLTLLLLYVAGYLAALGVWYRLGLIAAAATALYQQFLIRGRDPGSSFAAFLNNNWFGAAVFCGILLDYVFSAAG